MGYKVTDLLEWTSPKSPGVASVLPKFKLNHSDFAVLIGIACREHDQTAERVKKGELKEYSYAALNGWCKTSQVGLAQLRGMDRSTVCRSLKKLALGGFIEERTALGEPVDRKKPPKPIPVQPGEHREAYYRRVRLDKVIEMQAAVQPALAEWHQTLDDGDAKRETLSRDPTLDMSRTTISDEE